MDGKLILDFLSDLRSNNFLVWMGENKSYYQSAKKEFEALVGELIAEIAGFDPAVAGLEPASLCFRLNRDTRFSKDKAPYQTAFRAHISPFGKLPIPVGYFLVVSPGASFLGGGLFAPQFQDATAMVRDAIVSRPREFSAVLSDPEFSRNFTLVGEKLKNVPKGYDKEHPLGEYLKHKAWAVEVPFEDMVLLNNAQFLAFAGEAFRRMLPLHRFLNSALQEFQMPQRP